MNFPPRLLVLLVLLVPKLCLGMPFWETLFRVWETLAKQSFADRRSQTEFGNEANEAKTRQRGNEATRHEALPFPHDLTIHELSPRSQTLFGNALLGNSVSCVGDARETEFRGQTF